MVENSSLGTGIPEYEIPRRKVALFDVDRTLSKRTVTLLLIQAEAEAGLIDNSDELKRAMEQTEVSLEKGASEEPASKLLRVHARELKDLPESEAKAHAQVFFSQKGLWLPYGKPTFRTLEKYGYINNLVSAGPHYSTEIIASIFGARRIFSTIYKTKAVNGTEVFTGDISVNLATRQSKAKAALTALALYSPEGVVDVGNPGDSIAVGDSTADIGALAVVKGPFCVNPSPDLKATAAEEGWPIIIREDLYRPLIPQQILSLLLTQAATQGAQP